MSEKEEKLLRQYCAQVLLKYGFEFSTHDPVVPALYTIYRELDANKVSNDEVAKKIKGALDKLNPTVYNFNEPGEAWKFKMAESLRWLYLGITLVAVMGIGLIWWRQDNNIGRAREILAISSGINRTLLLKAKKDDTGFMYLEFSKAKGKYILNYEEYHQIDNGTIRVYLGKSN